MKTHMTESAENKNMNIVYVRHDIEYNDAFARLLNDTSLDAIEIESKTLSLLSLGFIRVERQKGCFKYCSSVFSIYFTIPRIYDEIWNICIREPRVEHACVVVENHCLSLSERIHILNRFHTYIRVDFFGQKPDIEKWKNILISFSTRIYSLSQQGYHRQLALLQEDPWYSVFPKDIVGERQTIYLTSPVNLRFFETDFLGLRHIIGACQIYIATKEQHYLLHKLFFGKYPFEKIEIKAKTYPQKVSFSLLVDPNKK
jgi:hypothetical protein